MSWLKATSLSLARQLSRTLDPRSDYEPQACYSSFCKHWQQAYEIISKSQPQHLHDDVLGVVNHLEQLSTLLVLEARAREYTSIARRPADCLEYLLSENLLDKLYEWAVCTGRYENAVRLEQLKLFGSVISHYSSQVIAAEPFLRPLLKLLSGFRNELPAPNVESQLVTLLSQLCVSLMQNIKFIDLFFLTTHSQNGSYAEFILVRLVLSSVHREGRTGAMARDALLLCAKMSARNQQLADYMLNVSNTCPVLATGLSGLYSLLPRTLSGKIHRLTPDDVNQVHKLTLFIDSLEFCNAVAQVAHPSIRKHLLDLLFQGFLVPVMGPALLQNGAPEQIAAMAYLELCLRCVTPRGLLRTMLKFLIKYEYDGVRVIDVLLRRLEGECQLSLVSLAIMETLIDLNCEDVMIELVYKHLQNGSHLMVSHRHKISHPQPYRDAAVAYLSLSPRCCMRPITCTREWASDLALNGKRVLDFRTKDELDGRRPTNGYNDIAMNNLVQEVNFNYGNPNETLFGNYHAYLCDARFEIVSRALACSKWSAKYDTIQPKRETNNNSPVTNNEAKDSDTRHKNDKEQDSLISISTSGYETIKTDTQNSESSEKEPHSLTSLDKGVNENQTIDTSTKEHDSLTSIGESSGYDSFMYRGDEEESGFVEESFRKWTGKVETCGEEYDNDVILVRTWRASAVSIIGPLLSCLLKKTASLLECELSQNTRVTGVISKLVSMPTPLLSSLLLCPGFVLQPNVPSLFQIINKLREDLDELTAGLENVSELVDKARIYLIHREIALVNSRAPQPEESNVETSPSKPEESPFKRGEPKRRSLSTSISMFARRLSNSSQSPQSLPHHINQPTTPQKHNFVQDGYWSQSMSHRAILNAVLLDEWLKELSALSEEHALRLTAEYIEDDLYLKAVSS